MALDIRAELPVITKEGTAHKPVWTMDGVNYKFVLPLNKAGQDAKGNRPKKGNRVLAKYNAGSTTSGKPLMFVGLFAVEKAKKAKVEEAAAV